MLGVELSSDNYQFALANPGQEIICELYYWSKIVLLETNHCLDATKITAIQAFVAVLLRRVAALRESTLPGFQLHVYYEKCLLIPKLLPQLCLQFSCSTLVVY